MASISAAYFSAIGLRLSFIVGVSSSPPGSQSPWTMKNVLTCSTRARRALAASTAVCVDRLRRGVGAVAVAAAHHHVGAHQQLAVVGDAQLHARDGRADAADL